MNSKMNQYIALSAVNAGLLIGSLVATDVMAAECGQAKLVEAGSAGVSVTKSTCQEHSRLNLGSVLELSSGSRMWVKFDPDAAGDSFQLICQNKSAKAVNVNIASITAPWIKLQGLKNCEDWKDNKLSCEGYKGEKNGFFCAVANAKSERSGSAPELTTSIKMRDVFKLTTISAEDVIESIKPDIELCKSLYNVSEKVEMSWTVSLGKIKDLSVNSTNKDLIACVEGVVKQANADQDISIKYPF